MQFVIVIHAKAHTIHDRFPFSAHIGSHVAFGYFFNQEIVSFITKIYHNLSCDQHIVSVETIRIWHVFLEETPMIPVNSHNGQILSSTTFNVYLGISSSIC